MADDQTKLTPELKEKALAWMKEKNIPRTCSVCGTNKWAVADRFVTPMVLNLDGGALLGGSNYPQLMFMCKNCSHTIYFNAVLMGIFPREETSDG